ncbi:hypothetical protein [Prosthecobacter sp.]|uniref:hypothetical protein n=1 Tax=Prosthecobacter sp. TaxID=1965333 RepID=UPI0037852706
MLQIITGKFFKSGERHLSEGKAVLYSNYRWVLPITTCVGRLEPLDTRSAVTSYLFTYTNQLEKQEGPFNLVRVGDGEIIDHFRLLCEFGLRSSFEEDRSLVAHRCRLGTAGISEKSAPSQLLPRYFASCIEGNLQESNDFASLVAKVVSLKRQDFLSIIKALRAFNGALEAVDSSLDLAYSILVYALESLSQKYISYNPEWEDFNDRTRHKLEPLLAGVGVETAAKIRSALLSDAHLKLSAGFQEFICTHVEDTFFISESVLRTSPLQHCDLRRSARNIYNIRSSYVHELTPLMHQLHVPEISIGDVFRWEREPYLTFSGLVRLADHVIRTLIRRLPSVENEDVNWRAELPGKIRLHLASQHWIYQSEKFDATTAHRYFGGFLENILAATIESKPITEMGAVIEKIERIAHTGNLEQRRSMIALYFLYNSFIPSEQVSPNWDQFQDKHRAILEQPCIEMMVAGLLIGGQFPWSAAEGETALTNYQKTRFRKGMLHIPSRIEGALSVALANRSLQEQQVEKHRFFLRNAILNSAGCPQIQILLQQSCDASRYADIAILLPHLHNSQEFSTGGDLARAAYFKFLDRKESGKEGDALSDWLEAELEEAQRTSVLREG